jgi:hypothetical protein
MTDIKPRDEVRVFDTNGRRVGQPEGGWVGYVTKVGRTLVHIDYGEGAEHIDAFRLVTGRRNDNYGHRYFLTLAQVADRTRRTRADATLQAHGIELSHRFIFTIEQIEALAEVVKTWEA